MICFRAYYLNYDNYNTTIFIIFIIYYYDYYFIWKVLYQLFVFQPIIWIISLMTPLFELYFCDTIITIMAFPFYYMHYFFPTYYLHYNNYGDENNWYNSSLFYIPPPWNFKWYMATDTGFTSRNAFVHIWGSYLGKNIAKSRWLVHLRFGRHTQETGV